MHDRRAAEVIGEIDRVGQDGAGGHGIQCGNGAEVRVVFVVEGGTCLECDPAVSGTCQ